MARKHFTPEKQVITNGDMTAALVSLETDVEQLDSFTYYAVWTGTPTGNLSVQVSNDRQNWRNLPIEPSLDLIGAAGSAFINVQSIDFKYARLSWGFTGGLGTLNAFFKGSSKGA